MANLLNKPYEGSIEKYKEQVYFKNYATGIDIENQVKLKDKKLKN